MDILVNLNIPKSIASWSHVVFTPELLVDNQRASFISCKYHEWHNIHRYVSSRIFIRMLGKVRSHKYQVTFSCVASKHVFFLKDVLMGIPKKSIRHGYGNLTCSKATILAVCSGPEWRSGNRASSCKIRVLQVSFAINWILPMSTPLIMLIALINLFDNHLMHCWRIICIINSFTIGSMGILKKMQWTDILS